MYITICVITILSHYLLHHSHYNGCWDNWVLTYQILKGSLIAFSKVLGLSVTSVIWINRHYDYRKCPTTFDQQIVIPLLRPKYVILNDNGICPLQPIKIGTDPSCSYQTIHNKLSYYIHLVYNWIPCTDSSISLILWKIEFWDRWTMCKLVSSPKEVHYMITFDTKIYWN